MWKGTQCQSLFLSAALIVACASSPQVVLTETADRDAFLRRVDEALKTRSPEAILAISDVDSWLGSGRPRPLAANLTLPPAPITRVADDEPVDAGSASQALYQDGAGGRWRLRLQQSGDAGWRVVLRSEPCPRSGGMARGLDWSRPPQKRTESATWTPLECWSLPK